VWLLDKQASVRRDYKLTRGNLLRRAGAKSARARFAPALMVERFRR
jgi:hypothetical protein